MEKKFLNNQTNPKNSFSLTFNKQKKVKINMSDISEFLPKPKKTQQ